MRTLILTLAVVCVSLSAYAADPNLTLTSPAFKDAQKIPEIYTCNGQNINPPLQISNVPVGAKSLVLIVYDRDSKQAPFVHWTVYNIPPDTVLIPENTLKGRELINNFHQYSYYGPCPPKEETHTYHFDLFAIDTKFAVNFNGNAEGLWEMIEGHTLAHAKLTGTYRKP